MRTLINVWLTLCGPVLMWFGVLLNLGFLITVDHQLLPAQAAGHLFVDLVMFWTAYILFNRIWQKSCDTKLAQNSESIYQDFVRREPTI